MRVNPVKAKLLAGECAYGLFMNFAAPNLVEMCGHVGVEFLLLDAEHGPLEITDCLEMIRACELTGVTPIVRVGQNVPQVVQRYLDIGALGIQLPMVNTAADATTAANSVRFPPLGKRGFARTRAADYGLVRPMDEYLRMANQEILLITQIETMEAVENLPELLQVPGIDVFFIGPTDLSTSLGYPDQAEHPKVAQLMESIVAQIRAAGRIAGTVDHGREWNAHWRAQGVQFFAGNVGRLLIGALRQHLADLRA